MVKLMVDAMLVVFGLGLGFGVVGDRAIFASLGDRGVGVRCVFVPLNVSYFFSRRFVFFWKCVWAFIIWVGC